jgi:hypothetical protein
MVIIIQEQYFLRRNTHGEPHAGIASCKNDSKSIGEMISALSRESPAFRSHTELPTSIHRKSLGEMVG